MFHFNLSLAIALIVNDSITFTLYTQSLTLCGPSELHSILTCYHLLNGKVFNAPDLYEMAGAWRNWLNIENMEFHKNLPLFTSILMQLSPNQSQNFT